MIANFGDYLRGLQQHPRCFTSFKRRREKKSVQQWTNSLMMICEKLQLHYHCVTILSSLYNVCSDIDVY